MKYAEEYKAIKDGNDIAEFIDKYGLIAFLDEYMEDIEGRKARREEWRQANKTCENCRHWDNEEGYCRYWDEPYEYEEDVDF